MSQLKLLPALLISLLTGIALSAGIFTSSALASPQGVPAAATLTVDTLDDGVVGDCISKLMAMLKAPVSAWVRTRR